MPNGKVVVIDMEISYLLQQQAPALCYCNKELMHWWSEGTSGIALAFIKAYVCSDNPTLKQQYKHYATSALLFTFIYDIIKH